MNVPAVTRLACALALAAAILAPLWYWNWGVIDREAVHFVPRYVSEGSLAGKIFDPAVTDWGDYQARELSYALDALDAHVLMALLASGLPLFVPLSALAGAVLTVVVAIRALRRHPGVDLRDATLLLLLYFTNYVYVVTTGTFYRSAKPALVPVLLAAVLSVFALAQRRERPAVRSLGCVFLLLCAMGVLDPQGVFYAALGAVLLAVLAREGKSHPATALTAAGAVTCLVLYNLIVAPWIIRYLHGYDPSLDFQRLPVAELVRSPRPWLQAGTLVLHAYGILAGGIPYWAMAIVLAGLGVCVVWARAWDVARVALIVMAAQVVMFAAMIVRYPSIYADLDHRLWYYPMPTQAVVLAGLMLLWIRYARTDAGWRVPALRAAIMICVVSNLLHWPGYWRQLERSYAFPIDYEQTALLKTSLRTGHTVDSQRPEYAEFSRFISSFIFFQRTPASASSDRSGN